MGIVSSRIDAFQETQNPLRPERPPLTGQSGLQALQRAEALDEYRKQVAASSINRLARAGQDYVPSPFTVKRSVPPANPMDPWPAGQVIWMDQSADQGLPHTRPPYYICMSRTFPTDDLANTLLHERVHLSQRANKSAWDTLLADLWDFKPWVGAIPSDIDSRRRINPDLMWAPLYRWKDRYVPLALFQSTTQPDLQEIDLVWWDTQARALHREAPPGWTEFFGTNPAGEHPFEIAAYLVAASPSQNKAYQALKSRLSELPRKELF